MGKCSLQWGNEIADKPKFLQMDYRNSKIHIKRREDETNYGFFQFNLKIMPCIWSFTRFEKIFGTSASLWTQNHGEN